MQLCIIMHNYAYAGAQACIAHTTLLLRIYIRSLACCSVLESHKFIIMPLENITAATVAGKILKDVRPLFYLESPSTSSFQHPSDVPDYIKQVSPHQVFGSPRTALDSSLIAQSVCVGKRRAAPCAGPVCFT